ncbi:MAG TPA: fluoride efflux transporter CrcB [Nitrososphaera sp.]|nr:fluoride efflux transporter CrcB [Nitrososphaera sp.]
MSTNGGWWAKIKGIEIAFLAVGAVAGALLRYKLAESQLIADTLPVSVLAANVIGSFILGIFSILFVAWNLDSRYSLLAAVGFCGSLTTMSSFALETVNLADNRQFGSMAINILANVGLSIGAIVGGRSLATVILKGGLQ